MAIFTVRPIGVVRSPFSEQADTPIQPAYANGAEDALEAFEERADGGIGRD